MNQSSIPPQELIKRLCADRKISGTSVFNDPKKFKDFIPNAAMPRIWWVVLASVHQMTEQRQQANYPNICRFMNIGFYHQWMVDQGICCPAVSEGALS